MLRSMPDRSSIVKNYFLSAQACGMLPPPKPRAYANPMVRRLEVRKAMTVAAGMHCTDGLVICADTEVSDGTTKWQKTKVWAAGDYLLVTGAGAEAYLKMAFDKLAHSLSQSRPNDVEAARRTVEKLVLDIHKQHIFPLNKSGHQWANSIDIWLIVGVRCTNGELALIKTVLTTASLVGDYEAVGTGSSVFKYWARYFLEGRFNMDLASYFSMFMLREAKDVSTGVGGLTFVHKMAKDTSAARVYRNIWDDRGILAGFPKTAVDVLLAATDLTVADRAFTFELEKFRALIQQLRGALQQNVHVGERAEEAFSAADRMAKALASPTVPEPPPEQSGSSFPEKGSQRGRRRP